MSTFSIVSCTDGGWEKDAEYITHQRMGYYSLRRKHWADPSLQGGSRWPRSRKSIELASGLLTHLKAQKPREGGISQLSWLDF